MLLQDQQDSREMSIRRLYLDILERILDVVQCILKKKEIETHFPRSACILPYVYDSPIFSLANRFFVSSNSVQQIHSIGRNFR